MLTSSRRMQGECDLEAFLILFKQSQAIIWLVDRGVLKAHDGECSPSYCSWWAVPQVKLSCSAVKPNLNLRQVESGGDRSSAGHFDRRKYRESQPGCKADKLQICGQSIHGKYPQKHADEALLGGRSNLALRGDCKPGGQERQHSAKQQRWIVLLNMFSSWRCSTHTKYMKESETDGSVVLKYFLSETSQSQ